MVISFGSAIFKIIRLLFIAMLSVHIFACAFYRVKKESAASQEEVDNFYLVRNTQSTVTSSSWVLYWCPWINNSPLDSHLAESSNGICEPLLTSCWFWIWTATLDCLVSQLVCFYYVLTTFTTVGYGEYRVFVPAPAPAPVRVSWMCNLPDCIANQRLSLLLCFVGLSKI